jgi:hypothetical protein
VPVGPDAGAHCGKAETNRLERLEAGLVEVDRAGGRNNVHRRFLRRPERKRDCAQLVLAIGGSAMAGMSTG